MPPGGGVVPVYSFPKPAGILQNAATTPLAKASASKGASPFADIAKKLLSGLKGGGKAALENLPAILGALKSPATSAKSIDPARLAAGFLPGGMVLPGLGGSLAGKRRTMNPTNVKALRRSVRRLEGFEAMVTRVRKAYPRIARSASPAGRRSRGHKSGCACVVCRRPS